MVVETAEMKAYQTVDVMVEQMVEQKVAKKVAKMAVALVG